MSPRNTFNCTTISDLINADSFENLWKPDWLRRAAAVVSICIVLAAWNVDKNDNGCFCEFSFGTCAFTCKRTVCCLFGGSDGSGLSPVVTVVQIKCPKVRICIAQKFARGLEM